MRIQLLLANNEVELTKDVSIPLNKSFQNLFNPTDIIVDYSKTVSIPITTINNRVLGNAYRLDRTIVDNIGEDNIGLYLDPTKRIPFNLLYNGQELMSGYAKFTSANYSKTNKSYNLNLFGILGEYFYKMREMVTSADKLTDEQKAEGGSKYVLNDHIQATVLDSDYVKKSWEHTNNNINNFSDSTIIDQDIIGFAPAYRGYYGLDFSPNSIQINDNEIMSLNTELENEWKDSYCLSKWGFIYFQCTDEQKSEADDFVSKLGVDDVLGDGLKEYQMGEYRSYHQRPFIYINKLFYMFQEKSKELTGYGLEFDPAWFNKNNPYWTKLIYTLNYLEEIDEIPNTQKNDNGKYPFTLYQTPPDSIYALGSYSHSFVPNSSSLYIQNTAINNKLTFDNRATGFYVYGVRPSSQCAVVYNITVSYGNTSKSFKYWSSLGDTLYKPNVSGLNDSNKIYSFLQNDDILFVGIKLDYCNQTISSILPELEVSIGEGYENTEVTITVDSYIYSPSSPFEIWTGYAGSSKVQMWNYFDKISIDGDLLLSYKTTRSNSINIGLDILYMEEDPIFNIILEYTKMFMLYWKLDDVEKKVTIVRPSTYFKDITVSDWNHKLDRSKDFIIEPITFDSNYVKFNYEDVDGNKYVAYRDKYGVNYGEKKLKTNYNFNSQDKDLFEGINPSLVSQRNYVTYDSLRKWVISDTYLPTIPITSDPIYRMESVDTDDERAINSSGWYFRLGNVELSDPVYITDDSDLMIEKGTYCWYGNDVLTTRADEEGGTIKTTNQLPLVGLVSKSGERPFGCVFNCPKEDYTKEKIISNAIGGYIYDNIWNKYINERYNVQNKKVTAYFNITPWEYLNFSFDKFVTVGNQLFIINKIFDYDLNSNATTKCELVQVTDISAYAKDIVNFDNIIPIDPDAPETDYSLTTDSSSDISIDANGQTVNIVVNSIKYVDGVAEYYAPTYTSNATINTRVDGTTVTYSMVIPENGATTLKTYQLTVSQPDTNNSLSFVVHQSGTTYVLQTYQLSLINILGGNHDFKVLSTVNGRPLQITKSNVTLSGISGAYINSVTDDGDGIYNISVYIPENTTTSSRDLIITVVQPFSNKILNITSTQLGRFSPSESSEFALVATAGLDSLLKMVTYDITLNATDTSKYIGGTARNLSVSLSTAKDGVGEFRTMSIGDVTVEAGDSVTKSGRLLNNGTSTVWVNVYYNNKLQRSFLPMQQAGDPTPIEINIDI